MMQYSEAIRLGAMLGPQAFGSPYGPDGAMCVNQGAVIAAGQSVCNMPLAHTMVLCPVCSGRAQLDVIVAMHLNDRHRWPRERIADFVESIEKQHPELLPEAACLNPDYRGTADAETVCDNCAGEQQCVLAGS